MRGIGIRSCAPFGVGIALVLIVGCGGGGGGSSSTSSTSTSSGSGGGTTGITYAANSIVYGVPSSTGANFNLDEVKADGTGNSVLAANLPSTILLFASVPTKANVFVIAANLGGNNNYGIYVSTGLSTSAVQTLVNANYSYVSSLAVSSDGKNLVYSAVQASDITQTSYLYVVPVAGGNPVQLDYSDGSTISPGDSNTIAYVASPGGNSPYDQVFTRLISAGAAGKTNQITSDAVQHILPAFNRAGTQIAYWESSSSSNTLFLTTVGSTAAPVSLPNPSSVIPQGECFSSDGSHLVIAADAGGSGELLTQATSGGSPTAILLNSQLLGNFGVYWTDANGRGIGGSMMPSAQRRQVGLLAKVLSRRP